ncbi:hypothetical protein WOSG25_021610 [Weissella oryzae SG25]|uniref:Uncharacterized protein n=1 Tax=Weissella oryzae (strain DSM 25784 / JCM 18191 / LMG 30913 / SG25) TaxID=1329250 RepID=A0A069CSC7_WEIOS|nr:hypothetical protein [Weissella oryzae]GAK30364.1 hypothetical protein WOSG25_021610 [Weissella oryzae SG25]
MTERIERPIKNLENEKILTDWYESAGYKVTAKTKQIAAKNGNSISLRYLVID